MDEPRPPHVYYYELPDREWEIGAAIVQNLHALSSYRDTFKSDIELFDFAYAKMKSCNPFGPPDPDTISKGLPWMFIAGRDGAMMLYHFGATLKAFGGGLLARAPTLASLVDTKAVEQAAQVFEQHFKDFKAVRHSVAHIADHSITPDRRERHSVKTSNKYMYFSGPRGEDGTVDESGNPGGYTRNNFSGRTFWGTVEGEIVEYDLTEESWNKLREVEQITYDAFQRARNETLRRHKERHGLS